MIHILFENEAWMPPLRRALAARGLAFREHFVDGGQLNLRSAPEPGVYINRMSPSSHTRGHQGGVVFMRSFLRYLEAYGCPVINGSRAFDLELSKVEQDIALRAQGIKTPRTMAVVGDQLKAAARQMRLPFITKHNQGGKGLGVQLFRDLASFDAYVDGPDFVDSPDGVTLLQQYVESRDESITRVEIVNGEFMYAIRSSTAGGFELCPADACSLDDQFCPAGDTGKFTLNRFIKADDPLVLAYIELMRKHHIDVAGIEFVEDIHGERYTYDINGTSNYNGGVEAEHGLDGMLKIAELAERLLQSSWAAAAK